MHVKLKTVAAASAATFTLLAACGSGEESGQAASGERAGGGTGESCTIEAPVPIRAVLSLTGAAASYGESQQKGLELAEEELAEKEGVTYELTIEDDQTDPRQGITLFDEFVAADVSLIIGPTLSNAALQADPIAQEAGVPVLGISNTAAGVTDISDYILRVAHRAGGHPADHRQGHRAVRAEEVVVMYGNDDAFTESGFEAFSVRWRTRASRSPRPSPSRRPTPTSRRC